MALDNPQQRDLVLADGQYAYVQDLTKGHLLTYTGPSTTSLSGTDCTMRYNPATQRCEKTDFSDAVQEFVLAPEGSYIVLENPADSGQNEHPTAGNTNRPKLSFGRKVIIPGPATFALWPGQTAKVIEGHRLRSNQYIVARVYNDIAANSNTPVMKPATTDPSKTETETTPAQAKTRVMGELLIIKGTEVSFYIPPTGIEVVPGDNGAFVREAVTLERLEWCLLLDEEGNKRYVKGPAVVFPEPTEQFSEIDGKRKARAIELNDDMGIYLKVIADYKDETGEHKAGDELFITGREQRLYYPREEHAIISYNKRDRVYGTVIAKGEARYVLNKGEKSTITLAKGEQTLLPDPRRQVLVRRVLSARQCEDWFPGNAEALAYNANLRGYESQFEGQDVVREPHAAYSREVFQTRSKSAGPADVLIRGSEYTPPRTISLDNRYAGAVSIVPWTGFAALVVSKTGARRVIQAPDTTHLEFDETLEVLTLSTGKPKTTDVLQRTAYLQVLGNQVSDKVAIVTSDMVDAVIKLSYRVNFVGEGDDRIKWFSVPNYVKFLCDHLRSVIRNACKKVGVEELNRRVTEIVRDAVLGTSPAPGTKRPGKKFEENNAHVYDLEVLGLEIGDEKIKTMLIVAQHDTVRSALNIATAERSLDIAKRTTEIELQNITLRDETDAARAQQAANEASRRLAARLAEISAHLQAAEEAGKVSRAEDALKTELSATEIGRGEKEHALAQQKAEAHIANMKAQLEAEAEALAKKAGAVTPNLIAALQSFGDAHLVAEASKAMAPLAILGGKSVAEVLSQLLKGTPLEAVVAAATTNGKTGGASPTPSLPSKQ